MASRKAKLEGWLRERGTARVEPGDFEQLLALLAPVSESGLRHLLRDSGVPLHPLVAGVNQNSLLGLRDSLVALTEVYETGNDETRRTVRRIVIVAKDHAHLAARNRRVAEETRRQKAEMAEWMLTWLENPGVFPLWARIRESSGGGLE